MFKNSWGNTLLKSALEKKNTKHDLEFIINWIKKRNEEVEVEISEISFKNLENWKIYNNKSYIGHESGGFFKIEGIRVSTNWGNVNNWEQPIINQPEIGILGFITTRIDGVLHFLVQAKIEPGNINKVQLSPTLQATKSNYLQKHKGKKPPYVSYFLKANKEQIILDQLQSEQGARFIAKRNRNIIVYTDNPPKESENFKWLTLSQLSVLMNIDNLVNMDTRTVLSGITFGKLDYKNKKTLFNYGYNITEDKFNLLLSSFDGNKWHHNNDEVLYWLTRLKTKYDLNVTKIKLSKINDWIFGESGIYHKNRKYFSVIPVNISIENREVSNWCQPLIKPSEEGICAFLIKNLNGVFHFLVQAKLECGNFDIVEIAPTVQCITGSYKNREYEVPFLDYVINANKNQFIFDTYQSEEGGRFYHEQNRNCVLVTNDKFEELEIPENYMWLSLNQLKTLIKFNNYLNIQARSLISTINF